MSEPLRIFIGYDSREPVAYHVLCHSILSRSTIPVAITPLKREHLSRVYTRQQGPTESTEFSLTRFLVPYLCDFKGSAIFMDCDMLCLCDVAELFAYLVANPSKAVQVVQHSYIPKDDTKFLGQQQTVYPRKNWSSMMLFNNALCTRLRPDYVNTAQGLELHRFYWLRDQQLYATGKRNVPGDTDELNYIGALPLEYNWLVGEYSANTNARILHYTNGGPWFVEDYGSVDHAEDWLKEFGLTMSAASMVAA